jgi:replicative DNA helicase
MPAGVTPPAPARAAPVPASEAEAAAGSGAWAYEPSVPCDEEAEEMAVAYAVASPDSARRVAEQLAPQDCYRRRNAWALAAAADLGRVAEQERRVALVADVCGFRPAELAVLVAGRFGPIERWTRKVRTAARRRRAMALAARIYNGAADATAEELVALARKLVAELEPAMLDAPVPERPGEAP